MRAQAPLRPRPLRAVFALSVVCVGLLAGCFGPEPMTREQLERGYVLLLPGVESTAHSMPGIFRGLREGGIDRAIDLDLWGSRPFGTFRNLPKFELNRRRALRLAEKITWYRSRFPDGPITIIGYSGGGAMAVFTAEALPEGVQLDRIVLLAPALSPDYDLSTAIRRCRRGLVNLYSRQDWFMVGVATKWFGTMDRGKTPAAGSVGFRAAGGELLSREGLSQIAWEPAWGRLGHLGGHAGWRSRRWARKILAPQAAPAATTMPTGGDP